MTTTNNARSVAFAAASHEADEARQDRRSEQIKEAAKEESPVRLFVEDVLLLFRNLRLFPFVFLPATKHAQLPGVKKHTARVAYGWTVIAVLTLLESVVLIAVAPAFVLLPGLVFLAAAGICLALIWVLAWTTWGTLVVESDAGGVDSHDFHGEKWFFLNGITTSHATLQRDVDSISATFKRPVTGVHNRSFGIPFDLIECLIQRSFSYHTSDVRVATASISLALEDASISKVVVLAHSQGGLILSLVLDRLYTILPSGLFAKLEIYTMGSAANFFHNPLVKHLSSNTIDIPEAARRLSKAATDPPALISTADDDARLAVKSHASPHPEVPNRLIHTIEHYVNRWDLVPRWGVLYHILLGNGTDYSGRVFVHQNASGHLFEPHYLFAMFPLDGLEQIRSGDRSMFLNHTIQLDEKEEGNTEGKWWGIFRAMTAGRYDESNGVDEFEAGRQPSRDRGGPAPTVKDLSRLWRYIGGGTVDG